MNVTSSDEDIVYLHLKMAAAYLRTLRTFSVCVTSYADTD